MTRQDADFYRQEKLEYRGLWNLPMTSDNAAALVSRLLRAVGEGPIDIKVVPKALYHATYSDRIEFIANDVTPQVVVHEVAHVIQYREAGEHCSDHDADAWNLVALLSCILEEVL